VVAVKCFIGMVFYFFVTNSNLLRQFKKTIGGTHLYGGGGYDKTGVFQYDPETNHQSPTEKARAPVIGTIMNVKIEGQRMLLLSNVFIYWGASD
jgi:hypothetical protein